MYKNYQYELFSTSWGIHEGFKTAVDKLTELLPFEGRCEFPNSKNKNLEKFRKIFGFTYSKTHEWNKTQWFYVEEIMETHFTPIIQNAIKEQGVI